MLEQIVRMVGITQEQIDGIGEVLFAILPEMKIKVCPGGGYRGNVRPIDFGIYRFRKGRVQVGMYEYDLKEGVYFVNLDLHAVPQPEYDEILKILKLKYPSIQFTETNKNRLVPERV